MLRYLMLSATLAVLIIACNFGKQHTEQPNFTLSWQAIDSLNQDLPKGITVYQGIQREENLRAWYVRVTENQAEIRTRVVVSNDGDGRETITEFAERLHAPVMINGGYFREDLNPAKHVGILKVDDSLIHAATSSVLRGAQRFYLHRSAISFDQDDQVRIVQVSSQGDSVFTWERPIENLPHEPGQRLDSSLRHYFAARDVLGAGPELIHDGKVAIAINSEVFFGTRIPDVNPRTAAGITATGDLILLVVDGRQLISRGVDLYELAHILHDLGCVQALNLDGGGSSALVVNGVLLNRPAGKTSQREVMSALAVFVDTSSTNTSTADRQNVD